MRLGYVIKIAAVLAGLAALGSLALVSGWDPGPQAAREIAVAVLCAILVISAFIALNWWHQAGAKSIVKKWAAEHGYTVLKFESPFHTGGFSFWTTSRGQIVYSVTIRDETGCER